MNTIKRLLRSFKARFGLLIAVISFVFKYGASVLDWIGRGETLSEAWKHVSLGAVGRWGYPALLVAGVGLILWATYDLERRQGGTGELKVELTPSSGPSDTMFVSVTNHDKKQRFHATCKLLERRNDPNPLNKQTYDLAWERQSWRVLNLATGEPCNLLIATVEPVPNSQMLETKLKGFSGKALTVKEWSRWGGQYVTETPEYDLEITVFGESTSHTEKFTLQCGGKFSALEMKNLLDRLDSHGTNRRTQKNPDGSITTVAEARGTFGGSRPPRVHADFDWDRLSDKFKSVDSNPPTWARWMRNLESGCFEWQVWGPGVSQAMCAELCKAGGRSLLSLPEFRSKSPEIASIHDDRDRWLLALLKVARIGDVTSDSETVQGDIRILVQAGRISDVSAASQVLCQMAANGF